MDGLKPPSLATAAPPLRLLGLEKCVGLGGREEISDGEGECCESFDDDASLDSLASLRSLGGEARGAGVPSLDDDASPVGELESSDGQRLCDAEAVLAFLKTYHPATQNQPLADLQRRYQTLQHQLDPRAQVKSIKGWFHDCSFNEEGKAVDGGGLWWTSEVFVPTDVAEAWGLAGEAGSAVSVDGAIFGAFAAIASDAVSDAGEPDAASNAASEVRECLRAVCGECTTVPRENPSDGKMGERLQFRTKVGARKAAALGFLWRLDRDGEGGPFELAANGGGVGNGTIGETAPEDASAVDVLATKTDAAPTTNSDERFAFLQATFHGAMEDNHGPVLSRRNPCRLQCVLSVQDGESPQSELIEVKSSWYQSKDAAVDRAFAALQRDLSKRGATAANIRSVLREKAKVKRNKPVISFETAVPRWASAELDDNLYLYELEFRVEETSGARVPVAETMGLDADVATRIGVLLGGDLFEGRLDIEKELEADFRMHGRRTTVTLVAGTRRNVSELNLQARNAAREANLSADLGAVSLARWFNWVVLRMSKSYGKQPIPHWRDLAAQADIGSPCGDGRTYLFLPLRRNEDGDKLDIDWRTVLETVHTVDAPVVEDLEADGGSPRSIAFWISLGLLLVALVAAVLAAAEAFELCSESVRHLRSEVHSCQRRECSSVYELVGFIIGAMSDVERWTLVFACATNVLLLIKALIPTNTRAASRSPLQNRFLRQQIGFGKRLFVAKRGECVPSSSPLIPRSILSDVSNELKEAFRKTNNGLRLEDATYAQYFENILQRPLRRLSHELVSAELAGKYMGHDLTQIEQPQAVPTVSGHDRKSISNILARQGHLVLELVSMLPLPRDMLYLCQHQSRFMPRLERKHLLTLSAVRLKEMQGETSDSLSDDSVELSTSELVELVDSATTATASDNAGVGASPAKTEERLESLGDSVLLFFLVRNLFVKSAAWDAECVLDEFEKAVTLQGKNEVLFRAGMRIGLQKLLSVAGKKISDVFEALLGAAYLADRKYHIVIGLLNEVGSQFPRMEGEPEEPQPEWYAGVDTWLNGGAPWPELEQISGIDGPVLSVLKSNATKLWQRVLGSSSVTGVGMPRADTTVVSSMECALFDDSLEGGSSNNETLECLAKLRDKLFHFGHASLQLKVVEEIYDRFPTATSGDIHLMKVAVLAHDVLAYVFVKNGFHEFLFDTESEAVPRMKQFVERADALGTRRWEKQSATPRYVGLAAGRLCGHEKKLPDEATEELAFSMTCIVGALALSRGVHEALRLMKPFFAELLLLSPDELRATYDDAPLVRLYAKGRS